MHQDLKTTDFHHIVQSEITIYSNHLIALRTAESKVKHLIKDKRLKRMEMIIMNDGRKEY